MNTPTLEQQIAYMRDNDYDGTEEQAILASLERLREAEKALPEPVEPNFIAEFATHAAGYKSYDIGISPKQINEMVSYIDALKSALLAEVAKRQAVEKDDWYLRAKRGEEMANAWEREAREWKQRAESLESELAELRRKLREPTHEMLSALTQEWHPDKYEYMRERFKAMTAAAEGGK